jgi:Domain of unknown function (DUF4189)
MRRLYVLLVSAVMALTLIAFAGAPGAAQAQPAPDEYYGAAYYGTQTDTVYFRTDPTQAGAIQGASADCQSKNTDCQPGVWVRDGWLAAVYSDTSVYFGVGTDQQAAEDDAMQQCQADGGANCTVQGSDQTADEPGEHLDSGQIPQ